MSNELKKCIIAFKDGYDFRTQYANEEYDFIAVDNPDYRPDDGSNPYLVVKVLEFLTQLQKEFINDR